MSLSGSTLPTQDFNTFTQNQIAAIQAANSNLLDFSTGSVLSSLVASNSALGIWIQGLITSLLALARLQTSTGNNVDTFIQQFGFNRYIGQDATGNVTFSRTNTTLNSYIPAGTIVSTNIPGQQSVQYKVIADTTNPQWDAVNNRYSFASLATTLNVLVQCLQDGTVGNASINTIIVINTPLTNVTGVTNSTAFSTGQNADSDQATRAKFVQYLAGLYKANYAALVSAVTSANYPTSTLDYIATRYAIVENIDFFTQAAHLGYFYVVVDNGAQTVGLGKLTLGSGGTGYSVNDVITLAGGTFTTAATVKVTGVNVGVITTFTITNAGSYTVGATTYTQGSVSPAGGTGATFNTPIYTSLVPSGLITAVTASITDARGFTIARDIQAPYGSLLLVFAMNIHLDPNYDTAALRTQITANVNTALVAWTLQIAIGGTFYYTKISQIVYDVSPYILDVTGITMNGGTADIAVASPANYLITGALTCIGTPATITYI
jgi:hypothetical protein